jgi:hypothetical protein
MNNNKSELSTKISALYRGYSCRKLISHAKDNYNIICLDIENKISQISSGYNTEKIGIFSDLKDKFYDNNLFIIDPFINIKTEIKDDDIQDEIERNTLEINDIIENEIIKEKNVLNNNKYCRELLINEAEWLEKCIIERISKLTPSNANSSH